MACSSLIFNTITCLLFLYVPVCYAGQENKEMSLAEAYEIALKSSPLISTGKLEVTQAEEELKEIFGTFYSPKFELTSYGGLISDSEEDDTDSGETEWDVNNLGPFIQADLKIIQPLYTFGKNSSAMEAGRKNLEMKKAMYRESINDLSFRVTKGFLGVVAGQDGCRIGKELSEEYLNVITRIEKLLQDPDSDIDASYLLEAQSMAYEIEQQGAEPEIKKENALLYLKGLLSQDQNEHIVAMPTAIPNLEETSGLLPRLLDYSHHQSPLLQSFDSGLNALKEKAELERKKKFPDIFVALGAGYGIAPNREDSDDDYNYEKVGAVLGLKWSFNFHINDAKEQKSLIQYRKTVYKKHLTAIQLDGKIRKAYSEAVRYQKLLSAVFHSLEAAKKWIVLENDNLDLGIGDVRRLVKAHQSFYRLKGKQIETRYHYLLSLAQLANRAGDMSMFLQWIQNGKVQLH